MGRKRAFCGRLCAACCRMRYCGGAKVLADPAAPLLRIIRADALETLLASGADNPVPWYGQLMTTPQTIAWFVQLNYWLQKYKVELV